MQLLVWANSSVLTSGKRSPPVVPTVPVSTTLVTFSTVLPRFVKLTVLIELVVCTGWAGKLRLGGRTDKTVPTPVTVNTCGLAPSSSEMVMVPGLLPAMVGAKVVVIKQLALPGNVEPQVLVWE